MKVKIESGKLDVCYGALLRVQKSVTDVGEMMKLARLFGKLDRAVNPLTLTLNALAEKYIKGGKVDEKKIDIYQKKVDEARQTEVEFEVEELTIKVDSSVDKSFTSSDIFHIMNVYGDKFSIEG